MREKQDRLEDYGIKPTNQISKFKQMYEGFDYSAKENQKTYSTSLIKEKGMFIDIMEMLIESVEHKFNSKKGRGRPSYSKDLFIAAIMKVYLKSASRQLHTELKELRDKGIIDTIPSFNTINRFLDRKNIQPILEGLITISSLPLKELESHFLVDGSGVSSFKFKRWVDLRNVTDKKKDFVKVVICIGSKSKIITSIKVGKAYMADSPTFVPLLSKTAKYFKVDAASADKGFYSKENFQFVKNLGGQLFVPFKSNAKPKGLSYPAFREAFKLAQDYPETYDFMYHRRSLVESVFSSTKTRFLPYTRSKKFQARLNETILKFLCYNLCVLVRYYYSENP